MSKAIEIIPKSLYWVALRRAPCGAELTGKTAPHFYSVDTEFPYWNFFLDFGPLNLGQTVKYVGSLELFLHLFASMTCFVDQHVCYHFR